MKISKSWISFQIHETDELNNPFFFMIFNTHLKYIASFSVLTVISTFFQNIIPRELESNIWRNNAYKISYIRKKRKVNITERRRNGDWMTLNGNWMVIEMYLPLCRLNGDWEVTEWRLSVFTEWWRFNLWTFMSNHCLPKNIYIYKNDFFRIWSIYHQTSESKD